MFASFWKVAGQEQISLIEQTAIQQHTRCQTDPTKAKTAFSGEAATAHPPKRKRHRPAPHVIATTSFPAGARQPKKKNPPFCPGCSEEKTVGPRRPRHAPAGPGACVHSWLWPFSAFPHSSPSQFMEKVFFPSPTPYSHAFSPTPPLTLPLPPRASCFFFPLCPAQNPTASTSVYLCSKPRQFPPQK